MISNTNHKKVFFKQKHIYTKTEEKIGLNYLLINFFKPLPSKYPRPERIVVTPVTYQSGSIIILLGKSI